MLTWTQEDEQLLQRATKVGLETYRRLFKLEHMLLDEGEQQATESDIAAWLREPLMAALHVSDLAIMMGISGPAAWGDLWSGAAWDRLRQDPGVTHLRRAFFVEADERGESGGHTKGHLDEEEYFGNAISNIKSDAVAFVFDTRAARPGRDRDAEGGQIT